ncbi:MAG: AGE family epimerase/isomerase [Eubacterium sp.]|nr:AGE family epimerase/isomerase [Eubacterium sp.]
MIEDVAEEVKTELTTHILPFWEKLKDDENGGYYGRMEFNGTLRRDAVKGGILHARILWAFSNAYTVLKDPEYLPYAKHAYEFLTGPLWDEQFGGVYWSVTSDGKPAEDLKHGYCQAMSLYAISSYYEASGDEKALMRAMEIYDLLEQEMRDEYGYKESFTRDFRWAENEKLSENGVEAAKTMNTNLHVFEAYTELYRVSGYPQVADKIRELLDIFTDKIYSPRRHRLEVFFDESFNAIIDLHSFGHDIEASWLLDRGTEVLGDPSYIAKIEPITTNLVQTIYDLALDSMKSSIYMESENGNIRKNKNWWGQCEAMVGFYNAYQKDESKTEYLQVVEDIWQFIKSHFIDSREGLEWIQELDASGNAITSLPAVGIWKCPYHNTRMCLEVIKRTGKKESSFELPPIDLF